MNNFKITLENIQHINYLEYELDLRNNSLFCLVGKNGIGKTTLIKSIQNFKDTSSLDEISRLNIIKEDSKISYKVDDNNLREDDFSSGEFMIMQIYKLIKNNCKLIVIDELDISLDSSAQVKLIEELRKLTQKYSFNILFTTHSLAIMKTMKDNELYFMENVEDKVIIENQSYNYIKAELFQFIGYDRIILVEDIMLEEYLHHLIGTNHIPLKYKIIVIAGADQTIALMEKNQSMNFFNTQKVITVLDGDQSIKHPESENTYLIPFESVEKELLKQYLEDNLDYLELNKSVLTEKINSTHKIKAKTNILYDTLQHKMTNIEMFDFINAYKLEEIELFKNKILEFLR